VLPANGTTGFSTSNMHQASHATSMSDPQAIMSIKRVLFGALVVAVAAEHGYLFVRATVRFLLHRTSWKGSVAENHVRRGELELKKVYLDEIGLRVSPKTLAERSAKADQKDPTQEAVNQAVEPFWKREDRGLEEIRRKEKTE
jgi:anoctamin-10